ncbi:MAG: acyltransferase [Treponema sp.]|nr:acyltransferase [Treponema sp.]
MYKPYYKPVLNAFADIKIPEPKVSKLILFILTIIGKTYINILFGFAKIVLHNDKILFESFSSALSGKSRCLIAFRHPDGREPQLLTWFFLFRLAKLASKKGYKFKKRPHAIFVYGYEVVRWGGALARLFMPNLGAIPIHHTKMDSKGMARLYNSIYEGKYPLALAPEGQVSYSTDTVPRLEAGIVRIGFTAASKMNENNQNEKPDCPLEILPLSVHFRYGKKGKAGALKLLKKIEKICGIKNEQPQKPSFTERLNTCRNFILELNEKRYGIKTDSSMSFDERLEKTVHSALETAEKIKCIKPEGDFFMRLYKVRHECWDKIYLPNLDIGDLKKLNFINHNIIDLDASQSWYASRHQEYADFGWYFKHLLPKEDTPLHLKIEYVQNLWDFANRTMGGAISGRINIPADKVIIKAASPINLTARLSQYKEDRRGTIENTMADLENAYLNCITEVNSEV